MKSLYTNYIIGILSAAVILLAAGLSLKKEWIQTGIAKNPKQKQPASIVLTWEKPTLETKDQRFSIQDRIFVPELAKARDFDGADLTNRIHYYDEKGEEISGEWTVQKPGIYQLQVLVESPLTKRENRKTMLVLVDGGMGK